MKIPSWRDSIVKNIYDLDHFTNRSFCDWLDCKFPDVELQIEMYSLVVDFLVENPWWLGDYSWDEILLAASGG